MKKFLIVDGNSIVNRAFYGIKPLSTSTGLPANAVYGFLTILKRHLDAIKPDYIACAFDVHHPTFRHVSYKEYKGNRKGMPDDLRVQMPYAKRAAEALGFLVIECPGFEADDVIGTAARMAEEEDIHTYILTGDRDSLQLVTHKTTVVLKKTHDDASYTPERFTEEYGVPPVRLIDIKALMGDSSDNIPGVPGVGEKTALALIQAAGDLDTLYGDIEGYGKKPGIITKLTSGRDSAYMSRDLATIAKNAPICEPAELFRERHIDCRLFNELCTELEFRGMASRFGVDPMDSTCECENCEKKTVEAVTAESLASLTLPETVAFYMTDDSVAVYDGAKTYTVDSPTREDIITFLGSHKLISHDFKSILRALHLPSDQAKCAYDTMLAAYLISPGKGKYLLPAMAEEHLSRTPDTPADCVSCIYDLYKATEKTLAEENMLPLLHNIEIKLSAVLSDMEEAGFKIDPEGIKKYARELRITEEALAEAIWFQAGHRFNINSPKQLGEVLFDEIGLPSGKKTKTGYSTDADTLESLRPYHSIICDILQYRQIAKLRGTYGEPLIDFADDNGRIHTKLNQTGTATGRIASSDPNLQNIPVRMELGRELRKYFIADEGHVLIDADYSQIELRILAVLSDDTRMREAFISGEDIHTAIAAQVFGIDEDEVTPELRRRAKAVNFGIVYGIGEFSLAKDLGITRKEAKEYIENYLSNYSGVDKYLKKTVEDAHEKGYTTTMFARRRNIPELSSSNRNLRAFGERVAMNSPIQGTAADVIKIAMVNVAEALKKEKLDARLIMQVHDELIVEASEECADRAAEVLIREMENAVRLSVPLTADCGVGKSWHEAK